MFREQIELDFRVAPTPDTVPNSAAVNEELEDEEIEFRLFAPSTKADKSGICRIRIKSPVVDDRPPGLVNPERPKSHYFRNSVSPEAQQQLQFAAVSGADVLARSIIPCPGCRLPWRVTTISSGEIELPETSSESIGEGQLTKKSPKKRKGKKSRIAIRQKTAKDREWLDKERTAAAEKEKK